MQFTTRKRRQPPAIIIISLIDILIVLLIFLMVTTTFKQQPALKLALPESKHAEKGAAEGNIVVTIDKREPYLYLGPRPVTLEKLQQELIATATQTPGLTLSIRTDTDAPVGQLFRVRDAAKDARIERVNVYMKRAGQP